MSNGSQIGGVIGAAVGLYVSGGNLQAAQLGYTIGPCVGGEFVVIDDEGESNESVQRMG